MRLALIALLALVAEPIAHACAPAPPAGEEVKIADEEAVIVWDSSTATEHFIRRAQFASTAKSFGFLVPTPTKPELGEVSDSIFYELSWQLRPEVVVDTSGFTIDPEPVLWKACVLTRMKSDRAAMASVEVMQSVNVAGFDATTLRADTPEAITAWLDAHGFAITPELTAWISVYVAQRWTITAFVVASKDPNSPTVTTSAVRMSFKTIEPFYPYREPAPIAMTTTPRVQTASRLLRVFFLADGRYTATLGHQNEAPAWSAKTLHASKVQVPEALRAFTPEAYLTVFHDDANPRVATDEVYFSRAPEQKDVRQQIVQHEPKAIPLMPDVVLLVLFIGWRIRVRRRKRQRAAGTQ